MATSGPVGEGELAEAADARGEQLFMARMGVTKQVLKRDARGSMSLSRGRVEAARSENGQRAGYLK